MRITKVEVEKVQLPLTMQIQDRRPQAQSYWGLKVIAKISTDEGLVGAGVTDLVHREWGQTPEAVYETIARFYGPAIIGQDPFDIEVVMDKMNDVFEFSQIPEVAVFARTAIDMALYDLMGKAASVPVCRLLGGRRLAEVPVAMSVYVNEPKIMAKDAIQKVKRGYKELKLKVGLKLEQDIAMVKAVREAVGDDIGIRVDANGAWNAHKAVQAIKKLERFGILLVEQPVPRWDIKGLATVRRRIDTPIEVDESLHSIQDARVLIENDACDVFNIKLVKLGGLYNSRKVVTLAESGNITCRMGSEAESGLGALACAHLVSSAKNFDYGADGLGRGWYKGDITVQDVVVDKGCLKVPEKPGLGAELDENKVKQHRI